MILGYPNGETRRASWPVIRPMGGSEPGELKHLSTWRKRNLIEIPQVEAIERGRAQTTSLAAWGCGATAGESRLTYSEEPKRPGTAHGTR